VLAVNKLDSPRNLESNSAPFFKLGIKSVFPISSVTGRGIGDLLDYIVSILPSEKATRNTSVLAGPEPVAVAIVGKPNVGKSSIFNSILDEERVVVSNIPGTTRTAIDSAITIDKVPYVFIDTAGLKKKEHRQERPDVFSGFQTYKSIRRSDVCLFVIDGSQPVTAQDQAIAAEVIDQEKGCIVLVNKIDLYLAGNKKRDNKKAAEKGKTGSTVTEAEVAALQAYISRNFPFLWMCPVYFVSGLTGAGIQEALKQIKPIYDRRHKEIRPEDLQALLTKRMKINPPKRLLDQKLPKVFGLNQIATNPPKFELLVNHPPAIQENFKKSVQNAIIKDLDFWGTPIKIHLQKKV
jgi:GTP-binding protein